MLYLGLDVHGKWTTVVGFSPVSGEIVRVDRMPNVREEVRATFEALDGPLYGVMEAGTNSWAMYRELFPYFERLVVADPAKLWDRRTDRSAKTDRRDALRMAEKLFRGEIEPLYIPDEHTQDLRVLVRGKIRASRWVTRLTNEVGGLLRSWGYVGERSLLSKSGKMRLDQAELPAHSARILTLWREMLEKAQEIEQELEKAVEVEAARDKDCAIIESMPDAGSFTALLVRAEVGDILRFAGPAKLVSYVGWSPRVFQSGDRCYYGGLGNWGNRWLKYGLGLLAQRVARSKKDNSLHRLYWRVCLRDNKNTAKVAVARKATKIIYHLLKNKEAWQDLDSRRVTSKVA
jgi:transposase